MSAVYRNDEGKQLILQAYDRVLESWPVPFERLTVSSQLGDTFVLASGSSSKRPLVLLHGAGSNSAVWAGSIGRLTRGRCVFAVDLPGEPGRSSEVRAQWNTSAYGDWLLSVFDSLHVDSADVVAFSQGGWTALLAATIAPDRISRLVLLSPGGIVRDRLSFALKAGVSQMFGEAGRQRIKRMVFGTEPLPEALDDYVSVIMRNYKPRMGVLRIFSDEELKRLTMPTLLLVGSDDLLRPAGPLVARASALLPHVTAEIVPGASHALLTAFDRVYSFLDA